jgi:hypothetical protein
VSAGDRTPLRVENQFDRSPKRWAATAEDIVTKEEALRELARGACEQKPTQ